MKPFRPLRLLVSAGLLSLLLLAAPGAAWDGEHGFCELCMYGVHQVQYGSLPQCGGNAKSAPFSACHQVVQSMIHYAADVTQLIQKGCYKYNVYHGWETITPCPAHVICGRLPNAYDASGRGMCPADFHFRFPNTLAATARKPYNPLLAAARASLSAPVQQASILQRQPGQQTTVPRMAAAQAAAAAAATAPTPTSNPFAGLRFRERRPDAVGAGMRFRQTAAAPQAAAPPAFYRPQAAPVPPMQNRAAYAPPPATAQSPYIYPSPAVATGLSGDAYAHYTSMPAPPVQQPRAAAAPFVYATSAAPAAAAAVPPAAAAVPAAVAPPSAAAAPSVTVAPPQINIQLQTTDAAGQTVTTPLTGGGGGGAPSAAAPSPPPSPAKKLAELSDVPPPNKNIDDSSSG